MRYARMVRNAKASWTAKQAGILARRLWLTIEHNPYPTTQSMLREAWLEGFKEEDAEMALRKANKEKP